MQRGIDRLADLVVDRRWATWGLLVLASVPATLGWSGVRIFEERPEPSWTTREEDRVHGNVEQAFSFPGWPNVLVLEADDFVRPERVDVVRGLVERLRADPDLYSVSWMGDVPPVGGVGSLLPDGDASGAAWRRAREACLEHPLVADQFLSPDGRFQIVRFMPEEWSAEGLDRIRDTVDEELDGTGVTAHLTGTFALWAARHSSFQRDHVRVQITAYVLVLGLALLVFRGPSAMFVAASGPFVAAFLVLGGMKFLGEPPNELTDVILPVLVVMIGFTDGVHLVVHLRREIAAGVEPREAARSSIRHVGLACLWTSITTAIGFASLTIARSEVVQAFGRASAVGVLVTFVAVVVVIPLLGSTSLGRRIARGTERDLVQRNMPRLTWIVEGVLRRPAVVSIVGLAVVAGLATIAFRLRPDDRIAHRVPHGSDAFHGMQVCETAFGGVQWVGVSIAWDEDADDATVWRVIGEVERITRNEDRLRGTISIRRLLAVVPGTGGAEKLPSVTRIPYDVRRWFWNRPDPEDDRVEGEPAIHALVAARVRDDGIAAHDPVYDDLRTRFREIERRYGVRITLTGEPILVGTAVRRVVRDLLDSLMLAAGVILVVMTLVQRSAGMGLISIVPNLFPLVATAAVRASIDSSLDVASACSFVICLGIAVDDTIHFLVRYRIERDAGAGRDAALRTSFLTVGGALVMTTLVLVAGFLSVMTSGLPTHRLFATMAAATVGSALLGDLVLLPALLAWTSRDDEAA